MRVGLLLGVRNHPDRPQPLDALYADFIEDCVLAEELGFEFCFVGEHHFTVDQWTPAVIPVLAAIAARTTKLRLGPGVMLLALHDPLRAAEDLAVLDAISGGRLEIGFGRGTRAQEFEVFGIDPDTRNARMFEAMSVIEQCFQSDGPFDFAGRFYNYQGVDFTTKPIQDQIPIWFGGFGPKNLRRAARRGYHLLGVSPDFAPAVRDAGSQPEKHRTMWQQLTHLAESGDQAWDEAQDGLHWTCQFYRHYEAAPMGATPEGFLDELPPAERFREIPGLGFTPFDPFLVGDPESASAATGAVLEHLPFRPTDAMFAFRHPGMHTEQVHRSMRLFAEHVLPLFAAA
jgi:alkanesulfonate monooxygenase SsuD/methylene tetrahydromethanopterin reductase-like flavin-dependent oxidoreductase (luciferase family)